MEEIDEIKSLRQNSPFMLPALQSAMSFFMTIDTLQFYFDFLLKQLNRNFDN